MLFRRIFRILKGRPLLVVTPMLCALLGGLIVVLTIPPRYEASSRVMMDVIKPDPITGFSVNFKAYDAYVGTQIRIIHDEQVADRVVEEMGWLENPDMLAAWRAAPDAGDDFRRWVARRITYGTGAELVPETNILVIKFQSNDPGLARVIADNIRTAYIEENVQQHRASAREGATNLMDQQERDRQRLLELQLLKANLERQTGIVVAEGARDPESMRLRGLVYQRPLVAKPRPVDSGTQNTLRQLDQAIAIASQSLGPNNPRLVELRQRREILGRAAGAGPTPPAVGTPLISQGSLTALIGEQVGRILAQGDKTLALRLVQDEIDRRRGLYGKLSERSGELQELAQIADAGLTAVGQTTVDPVPKFPNLPLVFGGTGGLGLLTGIILALLTEALAQRVRGPEDLSGALGFPVLGTLPKIAANGKPRRSAEAKPKVRAKRGARRELELADA